MEFRAAASPADSAAVLVKYLEEVEGTDVAPETVAAKIAAAIPGIPKEDILKRLNQRGVNIGTMISLLSLYVALRRGQSASMPAPPTPPSVVQPSTEIVGERQVPLPAPEKHAKHKKRKNANQAEER